VTDAISQSDIVPVILAGGSGSRLWPLSRAAHPKQFLSLGAEQSLLQETCARVDAACKLKPHVVCNEAYRFLTAEQIREAGFEAQTIMLEPAARNTAPAIAVAAWKIIEQDPNAIMGVFPADHQIPDHQVFATALMTAETAAQQGQLVTFGVVPTAPETGYGYIKVSGEQKLTMPVQQFVEKPTLETAEQYLKSGNYLWNSGMFVFKASVYLDALQQADANMHEYSKRAVEGAQTDLDFTRLDKQSFTAVNSESIDYLIMEKSDNAVVVPYTGQWSDLGSWDSVKSVSPSDSDGNVTVGDVLLHKSRNCYVHAASRLVATAGVQNLCIVETDDSILVTDLDSAQETKAIVQKLTDHLPSMGSL